MTLPAAFLANLQTPGLLQELRWRRRGAHFRRVVTAQLNAGAEAANQQRAAITERTRRQMNEAFNVQAPPVVSPAPNASYPQVRSEPLTGSPDALVQELNPVQTDTNPISDVSPQTGGRHSVNP